MAKRVFFPAPKTSATVGRSDRIPMPGRVPVPGPVERRACDACPSMAKFVAVSCPSSVREIIGISGSGNVSKWQRQVRKHYRVTALTKGNFHVHQEIPCEDSLFVPVGRMLRNRHCWTESGLCQPKVLIEGGIQFTKPLIVDLFTGMSVRYGGNDQIVFRIREAD